MIIITACALGLLGAWTPDIVPLGAWVGVWVAASALSVCVLGVFALSVCPLDVWHAVVIGVHFVGGMTGMQVDKCCKHVLDVRQEDGILTHTEGFSERYNT